MVMGELTQETEVIVIGAGPGGYAAAFRAADLGMDVTMVDLSERPGGVCLFRGCIPSKTYLYLSELIHDARWAESKGVFFGPPRIDLDALRNWKNQVVDKHAEGLMTLNNKRGIQLIQGRAEFESVNRVRLYESHVSHISFKHAVLACGSHPIPFPGAHRQKSSRVMTSTEALELIDIPESLLVIGGGYVGLELGSVYAALGSRVTVAELGAGLLPGVDPDLVRVLERRLRELFHAVYLNTQVLELKETPDAVEVQFKGEADPASQRFDRVLVAIGRKPNSSGMGLESAGVAVDAKGFVTVDEQQRTSSAHIFAVGDVTGGMMLAHKAMREGKIAAEVISGKPSAFDARVIPAVVYTDPQIAWCGLTEVEALRRDIPTQIRRFPWKASGRASTMGVEDGLTKMIIAPDTKRILGMGIAGRYTEGLITEAVLAIEMGALVQDLALSIHPHPTLSETEGEVAEIFLGSATHVLNPGSGRLNS
jgi:dihydrolipoamide dehydrogenase